MGKRERERGEGDAYVAEGALWTGEEGEACNAADSTGCHMTWGMRWRAAVESERSWCLVRGESYDLLTLHFPLLHTRAEGVADGTQAEDLRISTTPSQPETWTRCKAAAKEPDIVQLKGNEHGAIAKWLRRQIRNLFSFGGAGSNPAGVGEGNAMVEFLFASSLTVQRRRPTLR